MKHARHGMAWHGGVESRMDVEYGVVDSSVILTMFLVAVSGSLKGEGGQRR